MNKKSFAEFKNFISNGTNNFYEIGPKKTLLNFLPRTEDINTYPFCSFEDINNHAQG